jgi:transcriptional regulator with XRE-family HTH domain
LAITMCTPDLPDQALAGALRRLRHHNGSTQEHVAHEVGITVAALARIERGEAAPRWTTVRHIIDALEVNLHELAGAIEDAPV